MYNKISIGNTDNEDKRIKIITDCYNFNAFVLYG